MSEGERQAEQASSQLNEAVPQAGGMVQYELNGACVVVAQGEYDMNTIGPLTEALETAARKHPIVVLDVSGVTFADSTFLNLLIRTHAETGLRLVAPAPQLQRLLEITGADSVLDVRSSIEDATSTDQ